VTRGCGQENAQVDCRLSTAAEIFLWIVTTDGSVVEFYEVV